MIQISTFVWHDLKVQSKFWIGALFIDIRPNDTDTLRGHKILYINVLNHAVWQLHLSHLSALGDEGMDLSGWLAVHYHSNADTSQPVTCPLL